MSDLGPLLDKFYDTSKLVSINIEIPENDWKSLAGAEPRFRWRDDLAIDVAKKPGTIDLEHLKRRYDWHAATTVTISSPTITSTPFTGVAIIKKSFGGSIHPVKPSLRIDFTRSKVDAGKTKLDATKVENNAEAAKALIGTEHLILNNCLQDDTYIKQPLGYEIFHQGGIPYARCNLARVKVNNMPLGIYCNLEAITGAYLKRNFTTDQGNLYETEWKYDLSPDRFPSIKYDISGDSPVKNQQDLQTAVGMFNKGMTQVREVFDIPQITKVLAMQAVVKHWDGYPNNTFFYNDVRAVADPKAGDCKFKAIPSGIDAIFRPTDNYEVKNEGRLSQLILGDTQTKAALQTALADSAKIFQKNLDANLKLVKTLTDLVKSVDVREDPIKKDDKKITAADILTKIDEITDQLKKGAAGVNAIKLP